MRDGLGRPQTVLLLGGTSEIGQAIADQLLPDAGTLILAGRDPAALAEAAARLTRARRPVATLHYDALAPAAATVDLLAVAAAVRTHDGLLSYGVAKAALDLYARPRRARTGDDRAAPAAGRGLPPPRRGATQRSHPVKRPRRSCCSNSSGDATSPRWITWHATTPAGCGTGSGRIPCGCGPGTATVATGW